MNRIVRPELLDTLPPNNPRAVRSRRDLRRINFLMGSAPTMARVLGGHWPQDRPVQITEIGAGDGSLMLGVARRIASARPTGKVTLLDLQASVASDTIKAFESLGWAAESPVADVFEWTPVQGEIVVANLFLHHFETVQLTDLLQRIAAKAALFIAMEPRRAKWPFFCSRLLWAIGCNDVTRHDAVVSVQAGFCDGEISSLWPDKTAWQLTEQRAGMFSHLFVARKME